MYRKDKIHVVFFPPGKTGKDFSYQSLETDFKASMKTKHHKILFLNVYKCIVQLIIAELLGNHCSLLLSCF